jgi:tetratricopeptide (TPR) repeat protein
MAQRENDRRMLPYWLRFLAVTAFLLLATGMLVLFVMPQRFVLEAGLRESGVSFPSSGVGFGAPESGPLVQPPPPRPVAREQPRGPSEQLWAELGPVLDAERWDVALGLMDAYLLERPADLSVRRERARTLVRAGRLSPAEAAWERLATETGSVVDRLALARMLRDRGEYERAIELYQSLIDDRPDEPTLQLEYARTLLWAERYPLAIQSLQQYLERTPDDDEARLDLARALYWGGRAEDARVVLGEMSSTSPVADQARALDTEIAAVLTPPPPPEPPALTTVERARTAAADGDLTAAAGLYETALAATPDDPELWLEWIDFIQFRLEDEAGARDALLLYAEQFELTSEQMLRLAELHAWTGQESEAVAILEALLAGEPGYAEAWVLLGDLRRWSNDPPGASDAYRKALAVDPTSSAARNGLDELRLRREAIVAENEPRGYGPDTDLFSDSDDFLKFDLAGDADFRWGVDAVTLRAGYRRLEGYDLTGLLTTDEGGFGEATYAHWWSEAAIRTALELGVEHLNGFGTQPSAAIDVRAPNVGGFSLTGRLETVPAYKLANTYESVDAQVRADRLFVALFRSLGDSWGLGGALDLGVFDGGGETNPRYSGWVTLSRTLSPILTAEVGTSLLGFGQAAPAPAGRRLYWDPKLYWATTAAVSLQSIPDRGWGWKGRLTAGAAYDDERDLSEPGWVPQFGVEGGVVLRGEQQDLGLTAFYRRGREQDYSSWGLELVMIVRP